MNQNNGVIHKRIENNSILNNLFVFDQSIGKGTFGVVYKAFSSRMQTDIAIKIVHKDKAGSRGVELLEHEIEILKIIDHPNLIRLYEMYETSQQVFMVMELCHKGQLMELLKTKEYFEEPEALHIIKQLASALTYIHKMDIVHRDIKLENILVQDRLDDQFGFIIKITDFGLAIKIGGVTAADMLHEFCGTPIYMAPEMVRKQSYSTLCDVWAMGIISYTLIQGQQPFSFKTQQQLYKLIRNGEIEYKSSRFGKISPQGVKCIQGMLETDPAHRMSANEILNSSWITGKALNSDTINVLEMMKQYKEEDDKAECKEVSEKVEQKQEDSNIVGVCKINRKIKKK